MGNQESEKAIVEFAKDLQKIMVKHGVYRMRMSSYGAIELTKDGGIKVDRVDFYRHEDTMEVGHLSLDECLDKHNQLIHAGDVTQDMGFYREAEELMAYIKRRFWEVDA